MITAILKWVTLLFLVVAVMKAGKHLEREDGRQISFALADAALWALVAGVMWGLWS